MDDLDGISTFDRLAGLVGVGSDTLEEAAEFIGVGEVPDVFVGRMLAEWVMLQGLAGGDIKDREGPVVDEVQWVIATCS